MKTLLNTFYALMIVSGLSAQIDLTTDLEAHYTFTGDASDVTGNGYDGTLYGPVLVDDRFGNTNSAYQFDGINDYINTFSSFDYNFRTLSLWIDPDNTNGTNTAISQDDPALSYGKVRIDFTNGLMSLYAAGLGGQYESYTYPEDEWFHLVLIREDTETRYYVNGVLVLAASSNSVASSDTPNPNFIIGAGRYTNLQNFDGKIDDIRIYSRALSNCEVMALYSEDFPDLSNGLQAHYPFSGNAEDVSVNNNDGTTYGGPELVDDRFGNPNSAYLFDGEDDYIDTYSSFDYANRTVSLWIDPFDADEMNTAISQDDPALEYGKVRVDFNNGLMRLYAAGLNGNYETLSYPEGWFNLILVRDGNSTRYYVDGSLLSTAASDDIASFDTPNPNFIIGAGRYTNLQNFEGKIDDVRIYDRVLTDCELESLTGEGSDPTGIGNYSRSIPAFDLYPNPSGSFVDFTYNHTEGKVQQIEFLNSLGQIVKTVAVNGPNTRIEVGELSGGAYYVRIHFHSGIYTQKLIIQ